MSSLLSVRCQLPRATRTRLSVGLAAVLSLSACGDPALVPDETSTGTAPTAVTTADPVENEAPSKVFFTERAAESGLNFRMGFLASEQGENFRINLYDHGCGVVVGDINADGHEDLFFANQFGGNALFRNRGNGTFDDVTSESGGVALADRICVAGLFGDYDNDGDQDLYVTSTRGGNVLFRNRGDGVFDDVTKEAGVELIAHSQSASFIDYDSDGDLDLFVTNTAEWTTAQRHASDLYYEGKAILFELVDSKGEPNIMYRNEGDGTFVDVTEELGLGGTSWGGDIASFDVDDDGDLDMVVSNMFGAGKVYRNDDGKHFVDIREEAFGPMSWGTIGIRVCDADNDGRLDLAFADMHSDMWMPFDYPADMIEPSRKYGAMMGRMSELSPGAAEQEAKLAARMHVDYGSSIFGNTLFVNRGGGHFAEVSGEAGFETFWPWGLAAGDFDNDGREDLFLPSGMGFPYFYWPSFLMMNVGSEGVAKFENRSRPAGIALPADQQHLEEPIGGRPAPRSSRCAATADFNGDGLLDLVTNNFNDVPWYFVNRSPKRSYVKVRLRGTVSNRDGVGAKVVVKVGERTYVRQIQSGSGYLSQSSRSAHFGLGDADNIDLVEIHWPSGQVTTLEDVAPNRTLDVVEPARDK